MAERLFKAALQHAKNSPINEEMLNKIALPSH
jgi:hypothetical protein